ncbi:MAG: hypothetical protein EHM53_03570 [Methanoregulaceae archaeon]|nr:MAG: hypothetical protein EHM53_03570 [Methanoregulaceae archaeon]
MTGRKGSSTPWLHTTVILQPDIYRQALERGIDISDACNRALASLTGTEYRQKEREEVPATPPVIIARDGSSPHIAGEPKKAPVQKMPPVINADDPAAPARVVQAKVRPLKKASDEIPPPAHVPPVSEEKSTVVPAAALKQAGIPKEKKAPTKKRSRGDALKTFFSTKISRTDDPETIIKKDELYDLFARFCRDHRITPVPERKTVTVALKNQFALTEKTVDGTPCWTGIRLK